MLAIFFQIIILAVAPLSFERGATGQEQAGAISAEIISKRYSSGFFPVIEGYVEYDIKLHNLGSKLIENQTLWVMLTSENNKTHSYATYSILQIEPQASKTLHLGPFKIEEEGNHQLLAGMQDMTFEYTPDSFIVYRQGLIGSIFAGVALISAGTAVVCFSQYRKRKHKKIV